jgi:hypothetical protein
VTDSNNNNSNDEKALRWFKKHQYESRELGGKSDEQTRDNERMNLEMVLAPIDEAYRRGEISFEQARLEIYHTSIKYLHEHIKEKEEKIDALSVWGLADSKDPKIVERQKKYMERMRREDPVIIKLQQEIDADKKKMIDMEQELLNNRSDGSSSESEDDYDDNE